MAAIVRVWERIRKPVVATWRKSVERPYNWAAKGRSPQAAAWHHSLRAEAAVARGLEAASILIDLVKAFELVRLEVVWAAGLSLGFPAVILRLVLEAFAFARRLVVNTALSEATLTLSAILAGGSFATDALFIVLIGPCDVLLRTHQPRVGLRLFVDDLTIDAVGMALQIYEALPAALRDCIFAFETELRFSVSRGGRWLIDRKAKTVAVASSLSLARRLEPTMRAQGVTIKRQVKLLGIDFASGKRVRRSVQKQRVQNVLARRGRYKQCGARAARQLVRTGALPAMRYGAGVVGVGKATFLAARSFACAVRGEMRGRCTYARLALASYDPGTALVTDSLLEWARAAWDERGCRDDMTVAWKAAVKSSASADKPFQSVRGPAGAVIASAAKLGWRAPSAFAFVNRAGVLLDVRDVCPAVIGLHAARDLAAVEAAECTLAHRIGGPPDLEALTGYLNSSAAKSSATAGSLRALGEGGWWTQERLHEAGIVDDPH